MRDDVFSGMYCFYNKKRKAFHLLKAMIKTKKIALNSDLTSIPNKAFNWWHVEDATSRKAFALWHVVDATSIKAFTLWHLVGSTQYQSKKR